MDNVKEVSSWLDERIKSFLDSGKPNATQEYLAKMTGIPKSTVGRYYKQGMPKTPKAPTVHAFLKFFMDERENLATIMQNNFPVWWGINGDKSFQDNSKSALLKRGINFTPIHARILFKAHSKEGACDNWLVNKFGTETGIPARDHLLESGFIKYEDGVSKAPDGYLSLTDEKTILELIKSFVGSVKVGNISSTGGTQIRFEELPYESIRKINLMINDCYKKIDEEINNGMKSDQPKFMFKTANVFDWTKEGEIQ